tara:strand:+ start:38634 stop:38867 length:234 start_codon:yes stop_codon:yes gene_type:complete
MNTYEKHKENQEHEAFWLAKQKKDQEKIYYLQKCLKAKGISYSSRKKEVYPTSSQTEDKHVKKLGSAYNFNIQTIIN